MEKNPLTFRHLLFDLDGTLVQYRDVPVTLSFLKRALQKLTQHGGLFRALKLMRIVRKSLLQVSQGEPLDRKAARTLSRELGVSEEQAEAILWETVLEIFPKLEKYFKPMPGAREFLEWASSRYSLRLATNPVWPLEIIEMRVRWAGIDPKIFKEVTHVRRMHATKPHPDYYAQILREAHLVAGECLLVGNDPINDLSATKVGISVFLLRDLKKLRNYPKRSRRAQAWAGTYDHLRSLLTEE
jgi:FMN phosphatase YigB (HAD superfamily)